MQESEPADVERAPFIQEQGDFILSGNQWILCADHELDYSLEALDHLIDSITIFEQEVLHLNFSTKLEIPALVMMGDMIKMSIGGQFVKS